jgi:WD40 repeat protein
VKPADAGAEEKPSDSSPKAPAGAARTDEVKVRRVEDVNRLLEPLVIPDARVGLIEYPVVSSQRTGHILFLGQPVSGTFNPRTMIKETLNIPVVVETTQEEATQRKETAYRIDSEPGKLWRRIVPTDVFDTAKLRKVQVEIQCRVLREGMRVEKGQLLGMIDPTLTLAEMDIKLAKLQASESEVETTVKTKLEAFERLKSSERLFRQGGITEEEFRGAKLTHERYIEEEKVKRANVLVAQREIQQTDKLLRLHEIRAPISGVIRRIDRQAGEAVKEQEPILRIENLEDLQVEGFVDLQDADRLTPGQAVVVEPTRPESPAVVLRGHREAVTAVAVSRGAQPLVVSAGEDRTVRIWELRREKGKSEKDLWVGVEKWRLDHPAVVRSLACTGQGAAKRYCLTGSADGVAQLWDLAALDATSRPDELKDAHRGPIHATAFSADGNWCATGGDDRAICIWKTGTHELADRIASAHKGAVTSLAFAGNGMLVSAGRDNRMVVWSIEGGRAKFDRDIEQRSGSVEQLGVNHDGTQVLFDQGSQLRILNLKDWTARGVVRNPSAAVNFTTFALLSPDGKAVLTAGSADNRLQLWNNPVDRDISPRGRAREVRHYIWNEGPSTCAAFDPKGEFIVSGTRDRQVLVWDVPSAAELTEQEASAEVRSVVKVLDSGPRQVRIIVDVTRRNDSMVPGDKANLVIYPK